ncbi:MAG: Gfo/Idh/MocA family oxidoreductase [Saprospiraceae bacterium]|nr:Gfo/Idh/MocA family oxidoreductase [Saprospiraceae bacterium]
MHRRTALKTGMAATAGMLLPAAVSCQNPIDKKLGIALVGLGNYSTRQLAPALQHTRHCELKGIVTGTPSKAEKWQKDYDLDPSSVYNYDTFDQIAKNDEIDIIYVVLPNFLHAEYTIRAAKAGKHVICEKPMAMSVEEGQRMVDACKAAGVQLQVGYRLYFEPFHLDAHRMGQEQVYGKINLIEASLGFSMANPESWRLNKEKGGGGALVDLGLYAMQGARMMLGELPTHVTAQGYTMQKDIFKGIYETVSWQMHFPSGAISNHSTSYSTYVDRLYASAQRGWVELKPAFNAVGAAGQTSDGPMHFATPPYQQIAQMDEFAESIKAGKRSIAKGEEGLKDLRIIEAIFRACESGKLEEVR